MLCLSFAVVEGGLSALLFWFLVGMLRGATLGLVMTFAWFVSLKVVFAIHTHTYGDTEKTIAKKIGTMRMKATKERFDAGKSKSRRQP